MPQEMKAHAALIGELSHLYSEPLSLFFDDLVVGKGSMLVQPEQSLSSIVLAHRIPCATKWNPWYDDSTQTREQLEGLLPAMNNPSTILVMGHTCSEERRDRRSAWHFLQKLVNGIRSHASNFRGKEVSANGIELPPSADHRLTTRRLIRFLYMAPLAADNNVIRYENIRGQSIKLALTSFEL